MMESPEELIDKDTVHYQKINIFGESEVGKSSLISLLENYNDENYILTKRDSNLSQISYDNDPVLINQIKQIKFNINEDTDRSGLLLIGETYDEYVKRNKNQ